MTVDYFGMDSTMDSHLGLLDGHHKWITALLGSFLPGWPRGARRLRHSVLGIILPPLPQSLVLGGLGGLLSSPFNRGTSQVPCRWSFGDCFLVPLTIQWHCLGASISRLHGTDSPAHCAVPRARTSSGRCCSHLLTGALNLLGFYKTSYRSGPFW